MERVMDAVKIPSHTYVNHGTLRSAAVFRSDPAKLPLQLERDHDDLDEYETACFVIDGLPVIVHRYAGNPPGEYTVSIDWGERKQRDLRSVLRRFFESVHVPVSSLTWVADDIRL